MKSIDEIAEKYSGRISHASPESSRSTWALVLASNKETIKQAISEAAKELQEDKERLDWLCANLKTHIIDSSLNEEKWFITSPYNKIITQDQNSLREAITAAMKQEKD